MYFMKAGIATAARMPMMATTIMSSIRVKPRISFFLILFSSSVERFWETLESFVERHQSRICAGPDVGGVARVGGAVVADGAHVEPGRRRRGTVAEGVLAVTARVAPCAGCAGDRDVTAVE